MRFALLACALCAAACADTQTPRAQDPSMTTSATVSGPTPEPRVDVAPTPQPVAETTTAGVAPMTTPQPQGATGQTYARTYTRDTYSAVPGGTAGSAATATGTITATPVAADNSRMNVRDRQATLTPLNQGNSADEIRITAEIRRGVVGDRFLSFNAKNVKIITVGTTVTLRGTVNSSQESAAIEARARQTAGVTSVDNQLEVK